MTEITQIRKLSLWIFFIPLLAINLCLIISQNFEVLNNTFLEVDPIGKSGFSIPYFDGSLSISRASRTFPQYLIFKPAMFITAIFLYFYWKNNNKLVNNFNFTDINHKFKTFGILSAIFLVIHIYGDKPDKEYILNQFEKEYNFKIISKNFVLLKSDYLNLQLNKNLIN